MSTRARSWRPARAVVVALAVSAAPAPAADPGAAVLARWVILGPDRTVTARAVTTAATCPSVQLDAVVSTMRERAAPAGDHAVRVCEQDVPPGTTRAAIAGIPLPLPADDPERIVVLGASGCRVDGPDAAQACNDADAWPAARIAAAAAREEPQVVVHTGDLVGRVRPCPKARRAACDGPSGRGFAAWWADFFAPEAPLLRAAPWVVARGDAEACERGGEGWRRYVAPGAIPARCVAHEAPYVVPLGRLQLQVIDASGPLDDPAPAAVVAAVRDDVTALRERTRSPAWLLAHRPVWAAAPDGSPTPFVTGAMQTALAGLLVPAIRTVFGGHLRTFQHVLFAAPRAEQLVIGNGGASLDADATAEVVGAAIDGATVGAFDHARRFGYVVLQRVGKTWDVRAKDEAGRQVARFTVR